ncbi:MAG: hypothetical protein QF921_14210 [Pseudomonadales bacterium]|nr:hypothetical protein [Pseudomonadales bacterium]MDP6473179.1 hypothetical protein [Pseudomonadales bacterium]MDP6826062.1 hypothetical protein [Pseudomonadales bacterium]MDP6972635.1 hypothetical protein [Pseudomonadales bacterium]
MRVASYLFALLLATPALAQLDENSGLVIAPGWEDVRAHCGSCHDYALVTAQRGDRKFWLYLIRWMQATQKLWQFEEATEVRILDYLAVNYTAEFAGRRRPLDESLVP